MTDCYASAEVEIEIPFHDIDLMRIAWHGHYAKYLEVARTALLQQIGQAWLVVVGGTDFSNV